jgi:hypothetical protein
MLIKKKEKNQKNHNNHGNHKKIQKKNPKLIQAKASDATFGSSRQSQP